MVKLTNSKKQQVIRAMRTLSQVLGDEVSGSTTLAEVKGLVESAEIVKKEVSESGELPLPDLPGDFDYFAFSDGACRGNPGPGAWGSVVQDHTGLVVYEASSVEMNTTNNKMELQGAIEALKFIARELNRDAHVALLSDSKYCVDGMNSWVAGWKKRGWKKADKKAPENLELWQDLDAVTESLGKVEFHWVKGHSGHPQNEKCDQLANVALDDAGF